jgi:hypothetical protein
MPFLFFILLSIGFAQSQVIQLTGMSHQPRGIDFGDPSTPDFSEPGKVSIYTTGGFVLTWKSRQDFLTGQSAKLSTLKVAHPDGTNLSEEFGEDIWDPTIEVINGERILYGGVMTPTENRKNAVWPDDHWNRRTYAFRLRGHRWIRDEKPLWGPTPKEPSWIGHNYGHHFFTNDDGETFVFYEQVTEEKNHQPWKTEIFARKINGAFQTSSQEISILKIPQKPWTASMRDFGGSLIEGPRVFTEAGRYFITFSAGDYMSDDYGINLMSSSQLTGPYRPHLDDQKDLKNYGSSIEANRNLTWGAGRAAIFKMDGNWWGLYHGIDEREAEAEGKRNVFLSPVKVQDGEICLSGCAR